MFRRVCDAGWLCDEEANDRVLMAHAGADSVQYSHAAQLARASAVERGLRQARNVGAHGQSIFLTWLPYADANNLWVVPVAHASLFGVVKDFWNAMLATKKKGGSATHRRSIANVLAQQKRANESRAGCSCLKFDRNAGRTLPAYALPNTIRNLMSARATSIHTTLDYSRPYQDIVTRRGTYVMEDWLHFTETFSVGILHPDGNGQALLKPPFRQMWSLLRTAVIHYFRASRSEATCTTSHRTQAAEAIRSYARLLEQHVGITACKYNLHVLVDR